MGVVNHSAGSIVSYHMLVCLHLPNEVAFTNTNTNTISGILCTWALGILKTCFITELQIDKVTVYLVNSQQRFT